MNQVCERLKRDISHEISLAEDRHYWIYRGESPNIPIEWSVQLGETLYNMRSALDHLVWQLVLGNGGRPGATNAFPIVRDDARWEKIRHKLKGVSPEHERLIRNMQPNVKGAFQPFSAMALLDLHCLGNIDKHRHLLFLPACSQGTAPIVFGSGHPERRQGSSRKITGGGSMGPLTKNRELMWLTDAEQEFAPDFIVAITFAPGLGECEHLANRAVLPTIGDCLRAVQGVVSGFSSFSRV